MTDEDVEMLEFCSEKTGYTKSDIIRLGIKKMYEELKK
jgi:predicted DNA-binding protein